MKKKLKLSIILTLMMTMLLSVMPVQAAAAKDTKANALKAYSTFLSKKTINIKNNGNGGTYKVALADVKFALAYIDNDNIPELIIWAPVKHADNPDLPPYMSVTQIYKFQNGKVVRTNVVAEKEPNKKSVAKYYKKKNIQIVNDWSSGDEYMTLSGKIKLWITIGGRYADAKYNTLTKKEWNASLKKLVGSTKATTIKYYKNNKANRKKHLK